MTTQRKLFLSAVVLAAAAGLSACGGGGGGNSGFFPIATTPTTPPASSDPLDSFVAFVKSLTGTAVDTTEPVGVTQFDPAPSSEVQEPVVVQ